MLKKIYVGIDAGKSNGFAVWNSSEKKFESIDTLSFWNCISRLYKIKKDCDSSGFELIVVIEDVTQNPIVFSVAKTYQKTMGSHIQKLNAVAEQSRRVGTVWDKTLLIIEWCDLRKIKVIRLRPNKKSMTKMKSGAFKNMTKWEDETSSHSRDAACLIFGR